MAAASVIGGVGGDGAEELVVDVWESSGVGRAEAEGNAEGDGGEPGERDETGDSMVSEDSATKDRGWEALWPGVGNWVPAEVN